MFQLNLNEAAFFIQISCSYLQTLASDQLVLIIVLNCHSISTCLNQNVGQIQSANFVYRQRDSVVKIKGCIYLTVCLQFNKIELISLLYVYIVFFCTYSLTSSLTKLYQYRYSAVLNITCNNKNINERLDIPTA